MVSFSLILIYFVVLLVFYLRWTYKKQQFFKSIPTVSTHLPIIGCAHQIFLKSPTGIFEYILSKGREMGESCVLWIFHFPFILLQNPEDIKFVLTSVNCIEKLSAFEVFGEDLENYESLLVAHTKRWLAKRKQFNSSFLPQRIHSMIPKLNEISLKLARDYSVLCGMGDIDILPMNSLRLIEATLYTQFNIALDMCTMKKLALKLHSIMKDWGELLFNYYPFYYLYKLKTYLRIPRKDRKKFDYIFDKILPPIKDIAVTFVKEFEEDGKEDKEAIKKRSELFLKKLYRLLYNNFLTPWEYEIQCVEMIMAGSDTTAVAISNTLLCLAMNPDIQERAYQEIVSISPNLDDEITLETINKLEYFDRVVKESLRILPTVHLIGRKATANVKIGQIHIPAGVDLFIPIFNVHRNKKLWGPDAEKFDPDHFLPDRVEKRHRFSYIPFSGGQRSCIALKYAEIALRIMTVRLVKHFKFSTKLTLNELKFANGLTMILLNKHMLTIEKRD